MTIEKQLDMIRGRVSRMSKDEALHWFGAFTGALCSALDNSQKWTVCITAADIAATIPGVGTVQTKS